MGITAEGISQSLEGALDKTAEFVVVPMKFFVLLFIILLLLVGFACLAWGLFSICRWILRVVTAKFCSRPRSEEDSTHSTEMRHQELPPDMTYTMDGLHDQLRALESNHPDEQYAARQ